MFVAGLTAVGAWVVYIILHNAFLPIADALEIANKMVE
jgi:hypothetical protein